MAGGLAKMGWDGEWMAYYELAAILRSGLSETNQDIDRQCINETYLHTRGGF